MLFAADTYGTKLGIDITRVLCAISRVVTGIDRIRLNTDGLPILQLRCPLTARTGLLIQVWDSLLLLGFLSRYPSLIAPAAPAGPPTPLPASRALVLAADLLDLLLFSCLLFTHGLVSAGPKPEPPISRFGSCPAANSVSSFAFVWLHHKSNSSFLTQSSADKARYSRSSTRPALAFAASCR